MATVRVGGFLGFLSLVILAAIKATAGEFYRQIRATETHTKMNC